MTHYLSLPIRRKSTLVDDRGLSSTSLSVHSRGSKPSVSHPPLSNFQLQLASHLRQFAAIAGEVVKINVGGQLFQTYDSTLQNVPSTRLADLDATSPFYDEESKTYFFDRNHVVFQCILDFYRDGEMHLPRDVCPRQIEKDLVFWQLNYSSLSACCKTYLENAISEIEAREMLLEEIKEFPTRVYDLHSEPDEESDLQSWPSRAWNFLDELGPTRMSKGWHISYMLLIILSIAVFFLGTLDVFRVPVRQSIYRMGSYWQNFTEPDVSDETPKIKRLMTTSTHPVIQIIEISCLIFFSIEFMFRFAVCPWKVLLLKNITTILDLVYIIPAWIVVFVEVTHGLFWQTEDGLTLFIFIEAIEIFRVFRIFRFIKHHKGLRILYLACRNSLSELSLLLVFVAFNTTIFASFIYCAEAYSPDQFQNAFQGMWWALITMTTVGYGDMYPQSLLGYFVGSLCALTGILMIQMPIPVIVSNFHAYYGLRIPDDEHENSLLHSPIPRRSESEQPCDKTESEKSESGRNSTVSLQDTKKTDDSATPTSHSPGIDIPLPDSSKPTRTVADIVSHVCDNKVKIVVESDSFEKVNLD